MYNVATQFLSPFSQRKSFWESQPIETLAQTTVSLHLDADRETYDTARDVQAGVEL
jgi:hypothetical protein